MRHSTLRPGRCPLSRFPSIFFPQKRLSLRGTLLLAPFTFLSFAPNFLLYIRVFEPSGEVFFEKDVFFEDKKKKRSETFQKQQENVSKKGSI